jgi:ELWxxDGT repeat protein
MTFVGCDSDAGCEPWFTDGSTTYRIADLVAGSGSSVARFDSRMTALGGTVLFVGATTEGERALWRTDGTAEKTGLVTDFESPPADAEYGLDILGESVVASGRWILPLWRADRGLDIWGSDGTLDGTSRIATLAEEASGFLDSIRDIWHRYRTDCVAPLRQGFVTKALNLSDPGAAHLVFSDGVPESVELLALLDPDLFGTWIECTSNEGEVLAVHRSDGAPFPIPGGTQQIWRTLGGAASTAPLLPDLRALSLSEPAFERHGDALAFAGREVSSPGLQLFLVPGGTEDPESVVRLPRNLAAGEIISSGALLFHVSGLSGLEVTDGAAAPTVLVADDIQLQRPVDATWAEGLLFFVRDSAEEGPELWRSDGTPEGTGPARNLQPGPIGGVEPHLQEFRMRSYEPRVASPSAGRVVFPGNDGTTGVELWSSDGTEVGTEVVADIAPGSDSSWPRHLASLGNGVVLFAAEHPNLGYELFRTDGTAAGTSMVRDLVVGAGSSVPDDFVVQDGVLYFSAWTPSHGREAWRSDGTFAGTYRLTDVAPGPLSSSPSRFVLRGNRLFFTATDHVHGFELWARADDGSVPLFIDGVETGDAGRWSAQNP